MAFGDEKLKILILLTITHLKKPQHNEIVKKIAEKGKTIIFKNVTYRDLCDALDGLAFAEHEEDITAIVEDYKAYCRETDLIDEEDCLMRIVPTGTSFDLNKKHAMYFHPSDRGYSPHAYIGFYKDKAVRSMIKVRAVFDIDYGDGQLKKTLISGEDTPAFDARIVAMIAEARQYCEYEIATGHRFFCANEAFDTCYKKTTPGGLFGVRFLNLRTLGEKDFANPAAVAEFLKAKTWV
jgi:hypothetical protein